MAVIYYDTIMQNNLDACLICGKRTSECHHIIHGTKYNKRFSEREGLMAYLCRDCHYDCHHGTAHTDLKLKRMAQAKYEETRSREEWIEIVGKNYV